MFSNDKVFLSVEYNTIIRAWMIIYADIFAAHPRKHKLDRVGPCLQIQD